MAFQGASLVAPEPIPCQPPCQRYLRARSPGDGERVGFAGGLRGENPHDRLSLGPPAFGISSAKTACVPRCLLRKRRVVEQVQTRRGRPGLYLPGRPLSHRVPRVARVYSLPEPATLSKMTGDHDLRWLWAYPSRTVPGIPISQPKLFANSEVASIKPCSLLKSSLAHARHKRCRIGTGESPQSPAIACDPGRLSVIVTSIPPRTSNLVWGADETELQLVS